MSLKITFKLSILLNFLKMYYLVVLQFKHRSLNGTRHLISGSGTVNLIGINQA